MSYSGHLARWAPHALSLLRIVAALLFLEHGTQKLLGFPPGGRGMPDFMSMPWWAGMLELVLGARMAAGLFTRQAAFLAFFAGPGPWSIDALRHRKASPRTS